jgi:hypothetical protein
MAGITVPENLRPALTAVAKHHFWMLAAAVPLLLVPLVFAGAGGLRTKIAEQRRQIESKLGQSRQVTSRQPHPNESWISAIEADVATADRETLDEWRRLWHSQQRLRIWPADLGEPFIADVTGLKPGGTLNRQSLFRYREKAPQLARTLPARMGVADAMVDAPVEAAPGGRPRPGAAAADLPPPLSWNPENQRRIYASFVWSQVPITTQVLLAQEELWVYGLFCDLLAGFVKGATGAHDSPLTFVDELSVGFPAIGRPGAAPGQQSQRIFVPKIAAAPDGTPPDMAAGMPPAMPDMAANPEAGAASGPSWHPRFSGGGGSGGGGPRRAVAAATGDQPAGSPDDDYRSWIYVDFAGRPLSAAQLSSPEARMVHLMPFVLRVTIDQRQLDRLLVALAAAPIPIDVREVRLNPGAGGPQAAGVQPAAGGAPQATSSRARPHDVIVELRGTVALATRPEPASDPHAVPGGTP